MGGSKFSKAMNAVGGGLGVIGSLTGAYMGVPKSQSNKSFLKKASMVGRTRYGASDMAGLMSQWENTPTLQNISREDLYNPSGEEMFASMFGAGMGSYGAMAGLTNGMKGNVGSVQLGNKTPNAPGTTPSHVDTELMQNAETREEQFDIAGGAFQDMGLGETGKTLSVAAANQGQSAASPDYSDLFPTGAPYAQPNQFMVGQGFGCGGHMYGCGGHKYAGGGELSFDVGNAVATGLNLLSGGLGVALNYAGIMAQRRKAEQDAKEVNAANLYAQQLQQHNFGEAVNDTKNNMFNQQALQMMAMGGDLQTHGADFPLFGDFNVIGAGGTHEQNPYGGVFQGMAQDGQANLVEEDEVVWNDYVFSNRIKIPKSFADDYKLKEGITYAEAAKKLSKEAEERPNDPISQNGLSAVLGALMQSQEEVKAKREEARMKRAIAKMSPEDVMNIIVAAQSIQQPQQVASIAEEAPIFADGGHLYPWGGFEEMFDVTPPYAKSNLASFLPYTRDLTKDKVTELEKDPTFIAWTKYVNDNWDTEEVQNYLKSLDAKAGGNHLFDKEGKLRKDAKEYFNKARVDGKWGYYHLTPQQLEEVKKVEEQVEEKKPIPAAKEEVKEKAPVVEENSKGMMPLPTFFRYAPVLGSAIGALASMKPAKDYSTGFAPRTAHYAPIGDYLPYLPVDTQRYINAENQQAAAQLNAIMNASAGNRNMAMAQAALANQQRQQSIGQRMQAAEQINWDRLRTAGEFNRGTNMFNAQAHNAAELANLQNNPLLLRQEQQNAMMRHAVDNERDAAISQNLTALFDNIGNIGRENLTWNQANSNEALRYFSDPNWLMAGVSGYKKPTNAGVIETVTVGAPSASALGGYLLSKPTKKNRR